MVRRVPASDAPLLLRTRAGASGTALLVLAAALVLTQLPPGASEAETRRAVDAVSVQPPLVQIFRQNARVRFVRDGRGEVGCTPTGSTSTWFCAPGVTLAATGDARLIVE